MDETIRIYHPGIHFEKPFIEEEPKKEKKEKKVRIGNGPRHEKSGINSKWKWFCDSSVWGSVVNERQKKDRELSKKYSWFNIMYNWLITLLVIGLIASFVYWALNIRTERIAEAFAATALADYQAEQEAQAAEVKRQEEEAKNTQEAIIDRESDLLAKLAFGLRNFEDLYHYTEKDFRNLFRCAKLREKSGKYGSSLEEVVNQPEQWVGYYPTNPVETKYKDMAKRFLNDWYEEQKSGVDLIGTDYVYAIFTDHGLYLSKEFNSKSPYQWWTE